MRLGIDPYPFSQFKWSAPQFELEKIIGSGEGDVDGAAVDILGTYVGECVGSDTVGIADGDDAVGASD